MDADLDNAIELRELYGGDRKLFLAELEDAEVLLAERDDEIAELRQRCGELDQAMRFLTLHPAWCWSLTRPRCRMQAKQELEVNERTVVRLEGEVMQLQDKQEKTERERKAFQAGLAHMEEVNADMQEELEALRAEKLEWDAAKAAEEAKRDAAKKKGPKGGEKKGSKEKEIKAKGGKNRKNSKVDPKTIEEAVQDLEVDVAEDRTLMSQRGDASDGAASP